MLQRWQIVAAAWESVIKTTCGSLCLRAFIATGLWDHVGRFPPERPLRSRDVRESEKDPERDGRRGVPVRMALGSRVLTGDACFHELVQRAPARARWQAGDAVALDAAVEEVADNVHAAEGWPLKASPLRLRWPIRRLWALMKGCALLWWGCAGGFPQVTRRSSLPAQSAQSGHGELCHRGDSLRVFGILPNRPSLLVTRSSNANSACHHATEHLPLGS
jgi:hypothetical protein